MWYLTLHRPLGPREARRPYLDEHLAWIYRQHRAGRVLFSGPSTDGRVGIIVVHADSLDAARALFATEPFVQRGLREYEIYEWAVRQVLGVGGFSEAAIQAMEGHRPTLED